MVTFDPGRVGHAYSLREAESPPVDDDDDDLLEPSLPPLGLRRVGEGTAVAQGKLSDWQEDESDGNTPDKSTSRRVDHRIGARCKKRILG